MLGIVGNYHCMQFKGKLINQTWVTGKSLVFVPVLVYCAQIWAYNFFFQNAGSSVTRYHGQLSSCTISEKTNDPILRKLSDGRTDGQTDRQTNRRTNAWEWLHRMLSDNFERPIRKSYLPTVILKRF